MQPPSKHDRKVYTPAQCIALRRMYVEQVLVPAVREALAAHPQMRSAMLLVAWYRYEEPVHFTLVLSELDTPYVGIDEISPLYPKFSDANLPSGPPQPEVAKPYLYEQAEKCSIQHLWALFAAYCKEREKEYAPYAVCRRDGSALQVEIVGVMHRPQFEGVQPGWREPWDDVNQL